jgi:hypothetical protein
MTDILEIIDYLTRHHQLQITLTSGSKDACGGYGWHTVYNLKIFETVEYCPKCRKKEGTNYSDNAHPFNNHQHFIQGLYIVDDQFQFYGLICKLTEIYNKYKHNTIT